MEESAMIFPKSIIKAIADIREEVGTVPKDAKNEHFGYQYVSEREMQAAIRPLLAKHKLIILPSADPNCHPTTDSQGYFNYMAAFRLCHVNGDVWPELIYVPAQDKGDKAAWKANTGAMKYCLNRLFMLDTGDDPEGKDDAAKSSRADRPQPPTRRPAQRAPTAPSSGGEKLGKRHPLLDKKFWGMAFGAAEKAHGKDDAMKWHAINAACKAMGYPRMEGVPVDQFDELCHLIDTYPSWWTNGAPYEENDQPVDY